MPLKSWIGFFFVRSDVCGRESSLTRCCWSIQLRQRSWRANTSQLAATQWLCNTIVYDTGVIGTEAAGVCVHTRVYLCGPTAFVDVCVHMRVSACACTCVCSQHRAAVKWVNALKGLLGSPARSLPAIMRMFSVFSSISTPRLSEMGEPSRCTARSRCVLLEWHLKVKL